MERKREIDIREMIDQTFQSFFETMRVKLPQGKDRHLARALYCAGLSAGAGVGQMGMVEFGSFADEVGHECLVSLENHKAWSECGTVSKGTD